MKLLLDQNNDHNQSVTIPLKSIGTRFHYFEEFCIAVGYGSKNYP